MGIILFFIVAIFIGLIAILVHLTSKENSLSKSNIPEDLLDDADDQSPSSTFPYPDPYNIPPEQAAYLDEDGEILEDL